MEIRPVGYLSYVISDPRWKGMMKLSDRFGELLKEGRCRKIHLKFVEVVERRV